MSKFFSAVTVLAVVALALSALPALADTHGNSSGSSDITVSNQNVDTDVSNTVAVTANTGGNTANGGAGDNGGNGGSASGAGMNTGGNGGAGGDGGLAGVIVTGDATAGADVANEVNTTRTRVESTCGCTTTTGGRHGRGSTGSNDITVNNTNRDTDVSNGVVVTALTGGNTANGGAGDNGGNGGNATGSSSSSSGHSHHGSSGSAATNEGGNGGSGGDGGGDGRITTGAATAGAVVTNVVNRTMTRVIR